MSKPLVTLSEAKSLNKTTLELGSATPLKLRPLASDVYPSSELIPKSRFGFKEIDGFSDSVSMVIFRLPAGPSFPDTSTPLTVIVCKPLAN